MKGIVYISQAARPFDQRALNELSELASRKNKMLGITGYLHYRDHKFIQYIEGLPATVNDLMREISKDKRHRVILSLENEYVVERRFPGWNMKYLSAAEVKTVSLEKMLADAMLLSKKIDDDEFAEKNIWGLVDAISNLQNRLNKRHKNG